MQTMYAGTIVSLMLLSGLLIYWLAMKATRKWMRKEVSAVSLFKDFGQKMWMTAGLGLFFFGLYLIGVYSLSQIDDSVPRLNFFFLVYKHPAAFVYLGLLFFVFFSIAIYLARMAIKYLYNRR